MKFLLKILLVLILLSTIKISYSQEIETIDKQWMTELISNESKAFYKKYDTQSTYTSNYDIKFHRIELNIDPATFYITGEVTTYFIPTTDINNIKFDFTDFISVDEVMYNGQTLNFEQSNDILTCNFEFPIIAGEMDSIKITYSGVPPTDLNAISQDFHNSIPIISTLSEPYGAKEWWPCKQDLIDKADSIEVVITSPIEYKGISNGLLIKEITDSESRTCTWKHNYPIPAYLVAISVTNYTDYTLDYTNINGEYLPILNHIYPEDLDAVKPSLEKTKLSMELFENLFGVYPYSKEKYGHAQFPWNGGMEHATVSFMGSFPEDLIAHELAHQWFGDKITCGSWSDIWLNEGFATYLTGLTYENYKGGFKEWLVGKIDHITQYPYGSVYVTDTTSIGSIFSSRLSYSKGAMVLHMLRFKIGDEKFFAAMKNYLNDEKLSYSYSKTPDFIEHCEAVYGKSLSIFFDKWIYKEGYPSYTIEWKQNIDNSISLKIDQSQSDASVAFFEMPIELVINGPNGESEIIKIEVNNNGYYTINPIAFEVYSIEFDPNKWLISNGNSVIMNPNLANYEIEKDKYLTYFDDNFLIIKPSEKVGNISIKLFNSSGKLVLSKTYKSGETFRINTKNISRGIYHLLIKSEDVIVRKTLAY